MGMQDEAVRNSRRPDARVSAGRAPTEKAISPVSASSGLSWQFGRAQHEALAAQIADPVRVPSPEKQRFRVGTQEAVAGSAVRTGRDRAPVAVEPQKR